MTFTCIEPMHQFLACYNLKKDNGLILFDANVSYHSNKSQHTIGSQVQVIILPKEIAVYIIEFLTGEFNFNEMYSTSRYNFNCSATNQLEISGEYPDCPLPISIMPV
ncbi:MAG: hypothetical protein IPP72_00955 [Chitinophagaceae bacterium]|nr:hypothetical protein [Chitinophagaceae bacterium]